jgi:hypothetical protein
VGAHGRIGGILAKEDIDAIKTARLEAVKISLEESKETIDILQADNPDMFLMARIDSPSWHEPVRVDEFLKKIEADVGRLYRLGIRYFEVLANPNLIGKGWTRSWQDGREFGRWFMQLLEQLRERYSKARFGFPGLSPGRMLIGHRMGVEEFMEGAADAAATADWIGVNCHWVDGERLSAELGGMGFKEYRARYPKKLMMITEFSNPAADVGADEKAVQYLDFYREIRSQSGIGAAFALSISAEEGHECVVWRNGRNSSGAIAKTIGARKF